MAINPKMWSDQHFLSLSNEARLLWCYLLTGNNDGVPGLWRGGLGTYSDAMRWVGETTSMAMDGLIRASLVQYDPDVQILCVPNMPKYRPCTNGNVLKGWYRRWKEVAETPLKYSHIESIRDAVKGRAFFLDTWPETFGQVKMPEHTKQVPLFLLSSKIEQVLDSEERGKGFQKPFGNESVDNVTSLSIDTNTTITIVDSYRDLADTIWQEQEDLRYQIRTEGISKETRSLGATNPAKLELLHRISEIASAEGGSLESAAVDCRHALAVLGAEARRDKTLKHLSGRHWQSGNFYTQLGLRVGESMRGKAATEDVKTGRVEPKNFEDYDEPGAKNW